jgi:transcriptional regulator with XRE-family HTH domain
MSATTGTVLIEIQAWMARRQMSQSELARRLGVSSPWVNKRLHGVVPISVDDIMAIADVLDVSPMTFFDTPPAHTELRPTRYSSSRGGTDRVQRARVAA